MHEPAPATRAAMLREATRAVCALRAEFACLRDAPAKPHGMRSKRATTSVARCMLARPRTMTKHACGRGMSTANDSPRPHILQLIPIVSMLLAGCAANLQASPRVPLDDTATTTPAWSMPRAASLADHENSSSFRLDPVTLEVGTSSSPSHHPNWSRNLGYATIGLAAGLGAGMGVMALLPPNTMGWEGMTPSISHIGRGFIEGPRLDNDVWYWNVVVHPLVGAEYYLLARNRGAEGWQAALYSALISIYWEFGPEAIFEYPSTQDLIITPLAGAILGECRYQARKALIDPRTGRANSTWKQVIVVILDPVEALTE